MFLISSSTSNQESIAIWFYAHIYSLEVHFPILDFDRGLCQEYYSFAIRKKGLMKIVL